MVIAPNGNVYVVNEVRVNSDLVICQVYENIDHYNNGDTAFTKSLFQGIILPTLDTKLQLTADGGISIKQNVYNVAENELSLYLSSGGV